MTTLADAEARARALRDLRSTLLVEAAAGTGKTALMAGRLTMLLADGIQPIHIAAITFTELAASELATRVYRFIDELLAGRVPEAMSPALPDGLNAAQGAALAAGAATLDELTTATIHGFCQNIIHSYAVEADIDPGARILDASQAEAAFDAVFEQWLRRRLTGPARAGDPIATLSRDDPRHVADVADVDFAGQHSVHDDCALQSDLKINLRTRREVFLVELFAAHDHAGPRLGVVGLIADHEIDRAALLAVILHFLRPSLLRATEHAAAPDE